MLHCTILIVMSSLNEDTIIPKPIPRLVLLNAVDSEIACSELMFIPLKKNRIDEL